MRIQIAEPRTRNPKAANTAVLYARVSSKDQEREGFSIPAQKKLLRDYATRERLTILQEFVDVETAKQAGRGGFGEMLAFLKATPACRTILVEKTDRLYRNFRDYVTLEELSIAVHFVKEHAVISPESRSSDKLMHNIKVAMAKNYVDNLSEEVRKGLREKAEQGHWPSVAPVGYLNNLVTRRIEVDPLRGPLVTRLFELYATGE
jgi:site-specific DNA recombinase